MSSSAPTIHWEGSEPDLFRVLPPWQVKKSDDIFWLQPGSHGYAQYIIPFPGGPLKLDGLVVAFSDMDGENWFFTLANRELRRYKPGKAPWGKSDLTRLKTTD